MKKPLSINIYLIREVVLKNHKIYFIEEIQTQILKLCGSIL